MSTEAKVGAFVIAGLLMLGLAIFLLGDFTFEKRYPLFVSFNDVSGLAEKSPIKLSGVEVGKVTAITLVGRKARVEAMIRKGVVIYRDSHLTIGSTGIIGSKYLQIDQGDPASGVLQPGEELSGEDPVSIEKALTKALKSLQDLMGGLGGDEDKQTPLTKNFNATVANIRSITANLDELVADVKPQLTNAMGRMDHITEKLDSILAKTDQMMAAINSAKGPVGALLHDEKMKEEVKETVTSLKDTAGSIKDILGRVNQFRVFWSYDWRYEHAIKGSRGDIGLRVQPREGRYYYVGGSNLGNASDQTRSTDYARKNTADALLGFRWDPAGLGNVDLGVGVLRSAGGGRLTWTPFKDHPVAGRVSVFGEAFDFGRDRIVNSRRFDHPQYNFGAMGRVSRLVGVGARVEDVQEVPRYQSWVNVTFEDKDIAYLFGMISFGAAGTKGRSKSK